MNNATAASIADTKVSILIPVRNEGLNLRIMLKILKAVVEVPYEVLVIYDHPDDDSVPVVNELKDEQPQLRAVHNTIGPGVANAIRAGVDRSQGEYILIFAADEVGPVLAIEDMLKLMEDGCEFVSCTRYAHGGRRLGGTFIGGILSRTANRLFQMIAGISFTDCTTGIKMFRRSVFNQLHLEAKPVGWAVAFEMAIKAQHLRLRLGEVPIISIDRLYGGKSTFKLGSWTVEYSKWFLWGVIHLRRLGRKAPKVEVVLPSYYVPVR
ncbi:MAG: glycosyltransferase [Planctomycetes bacterium]|nr:glycosyltransferase [Planctomycetota bacterium]